MAFSRPFAKATLLCFLFALGACGGGGEEDKAADPQTPHTPATPPDTPTVTGYPTLDESAAALYRRNAEFNGADPSDAEENAVRSGFGARSLCAGSGNIYCAGTSSYRLQNLDFAHSATLTDGRKVTGEGTLIAIVDDGYRLSHRELAGKEIALFTGSAAGIGSNSHGTAVAAIAAGMADGTGMMGVAPDAALHLSSWEDSADDTIITHLAAATQDAARRGAVVQNNSWGFTEDLSASRERGDFAASGETDYARFLAKSHGGAQSEWRDLISAYDAFQKTGVIVFANSNDAALDDAVAWSALPEFAPELSEAWLTVSNALFEIDRRDGSILAADLLSAPCGSAARYCLTADGTLRVPTENTDSSYMIGTGTSYAAPQVSGDIALLAQAFPDLAPSEWTARLLATARRDWPGFRSTIAGETVFAGSVKRAYSSLYGHGVPDMKAALSPVGGLAIPTAAHISGASVPLSEGISLEAPLIGNAIGKKLSGKTIMAIDALGANFPISGKIIKSANYRAASINQQPFAGSFRTLAALESSFTFAPVETASSRMLREAALPKLLFSQNFISSVGATSFSNLLPLGEGAFLQLAGSMSPGEDSANFSASRLFSRGFLSGELGFSMNFSAGRFFGETVRGPFLEPKSSVDMASSLALVADLGGGWSITGFAELGSGFTQNSTHALATMGAISHLSASLFAGKRNLLLEGDMTRLYAGIRPTALEGTARVRLPVGRTASGTVTYELYEVELADADLPLRFGLTYDARLPRNFDVRFNANADFLGGSGERPILDMALGLHKGF